MTAAPTQSVVAQAAFTPAPTPTASLVRTGDDARAIDLVRATLSAPQSISYVGQVQTIRWGPNGAAATISRVEHLAPDRTHRSFLAPESVYGDAVVVHGTSTFAFDMHKQRIVVNKGPAPDSEGTTNDNFNLLLANYRPLRGSPETIAGRECTPVSLVNRFTGERMMRLWVDNRTKLVLQKETYHANGALASRTQFDHIRYTSDIPTDVFATSAPEGFTMVNGREAAQPSTDIERTLKSAGFPPAGPHYLPEGFTIVSADVAVVNTVKTLHVLYSDGVRSLSLFENATGAAADFGTLHPQETRVEHFDAKYVEDGPTTLLSWKEQGLYLALVGDLELKELRAIAASVIP